MKTSDQRVKTMTVAPTGNSTGTVSMSNTLHDHAYKTLLGAATDPAISLDADTIKAVLGDDFTKYIEQRLGIQEQPLSQAERDDLHERLEELKEALKQQTLPSASAPAAATGVVIHDKDVLTLLTRAEGFRSGLQRVYFTVVKGELKARFEDGVLTPQR